MTDPSFTSEADRDLLVVLPDPGRRPSRPPRPCSEPGSPPTDVRVDAEPDRIASLRAEMHEELCEAFVVPNAGVAYPKEAARGLVLGDLIGVGLGVLAAFPSALIPIGDTSYPTRLLIFALVGVAFGLAIGLVAGPAVTSIRPDLPPAIERGTLLRVGHDSAELRRLLADLHPIRMDEIRRVGRPAHRHRGHRGLRLRASRPRSMPMENVQQGDDYHPPDRRRPSALDRGAPGLGEQGRRVEEGHPLGWPCPGRRARRSRRPATRPARR